jgi:hypothetical protein
MWGDAGLSRSPYDGTMSSSPIRRDESRNSNALSPDQLADHLISLID